MHEGAALLEPGDPTGREKRRQLPGSSRQRGGQRRDVVAVDPDRPGEGELLRTVRSLNADASVHGILVQLPLPGGIDAHRVIESIDPRKDVDGFHPLNIGYLQAGLPGLSPCTPAGIMALLDHYGIRVKQSYVMDKNSFRQEMPQALGGGERPIYFAPMVEDQMINHDLDFMQNINRLVAVRISPLELIEERLEESDIKAYRVFSSSAKSWEMRQRPPRRWVSP